MLWKSKQENVKINVSTTYLSPIQKRAIDVMNPHHKSKDNIKCLLNKFSPTPLDFLWRHHKLIN